MLTNRQILGIIAQKEEYERRLESLKSANEFGTVLIAPAFFS